MGDWGVKVLGKIKGMKNHDQNILYKNTIRKPFKSILILSLKKLRILISETIAIVGVGDDGECVCGCVFTVLC